MALYCATGWQTLARGTWAGLSLVYLQTVLQSVEVCCQTRMLHFATIVAHCSYIALFLARVKQVHGFSFDVAYFRKVLTITEIFMAQNILAKMSRIELV